MDGGLRGTAASTPAPDSEETPVIDTIVFDVDGTLVDTNYQHAVAWYEAFRRFDITPALWRIHRAIGMGGDQLVEAVAGREAEESYGDDLRAAWSEAYEGYLPHVQPFEGAKELLQQVRDRDLRLVLASSGQRDHVDHYLDLLNGRRIAHDWTTSEDAEQTKPAPDLVQTALAKVGGGDAVMIGDSTWDAKAAERAGISTYAVRTGGFSVEELEQAGARRVYDSLVDLGADLDVIVEGN
jgi:HAD superfamily hydrolase (TIGR01549 family)